MSIAVFYKTKYGSTRVYAEYIAQKLGCECFDMKDVSIEKLLEYDRIVYGGGLYSQVINGFGRVMKRYDEFKDKKIAVFTTGITPLDCRDYYDEYVLKQNFKGGVPDNIRVFNFLGKMKKSELSPVHKAALATLKKIMTAKKEQTDMVKMLIKLCDFDDDQTCLPDSDELINYISE